MPPRAKQPGLAAKLAELRANKGSLRVGSLDDFDMSVKAITTGNIAIDSITGVGGLPRGRVIECYGPPSSGKTTTALQAAARLIQAGGRVLFLDYEKSLDPEYVQALGIDPKNEAFIYTQPDTFEQGANLFRDLMLTGELDMLIADSVAAMVTQKELDAETGKANVADRAKLMAQFMRQITGQVQKYQVVAVFLNHIQEVIDASPMGQKLRAQGIVRKTTPGGSALKFYSSMRIEYKQIGNIRTDVYDPLTNEKVADIRQTKVQVTVVKNKVAAPFKQCEVRVRYGHGFSQAWSVFDVLVAHRAVKKGAGGVYTFPDGLEQGLPGDPQCVVFRGEENVLSLIETDPEWLGRLEQHARGLLAQHGAFQADALEWADEDTEGTQVMVPVPENVDPETGEIRDFAAPAD